MTGRQQRGKPGQHAQAADGATRSARAAEAGGPRAWGEAHREAQLATPHAASRGETNTEPEWATPHAVSRGETNTFRKATDWLLLFNIATHWFHPLKTRGRCANFGGKTYRRDCFHPSKMRGRCAHFGGKTYPRAESYATPWPQRCRDSATQSVPNELRPCSEASPCHARSCGHKSCMPCHGCPAVQLLEPRVHGYPIPLRSRPEGPTHVLT